MTSAIIVFALAFAALGLLLGYAATFNVESEHEPPFRTGGLNGTNITIEESVSVGIVRSSAG